MNERAGKIRRADLSWRQRSIDNKKRTQGRVPADVGVIIAVQSWTQNSLVLIKVIFDRSHARLARQRDRNLAHAVALEDEDGRRFHVGIC